jgi:hypothetical protein
LDEQYLSNSVGLACFAGVVIRLIDEHAIHGWRDFIGDFVAILGMDIDDRVEYRYGAILVVGFLVGGDGGSARFCVLDVDFR